MVYPGEERVIVVLDPGNIACLNGIENIASCAATIKEDGDYRVIIIRANKVGETVNDSFTFPFECLGDTNAGQGRKYVANHLYSFALHYLVFVGLTIK